MKGGGKYLWGQEEDEESTCPSKEQEGIRYDIRKAKTRPSSTSIRDLLSNGTFTEAVLSSLKDTKVSWPTKEA